MPPLSPPIPDHVLWDRFRNGDRMAFEEIVSGHYKSLFRFGSRYTRDKALLEDCLHDLFVYLWEKRRTVNSTDSIRRYLLTAFRNKILLELDRIRKRGWTDEDAVTGTAFEEDTSHFAHDDDTSPKLELLIGRLPARQQEAIYLRYYEGMDVSQIAGIMDISTQSVSNHLHKALLSLRQYARQFSLWVSLAALPLFSFLA